MEMWKPSKEGIYMLRGVPVPVTNPGDTGVGWRVGEITARLESDPILDIGSVPDGLSWSLLRPGWQPGAPTVAQLERWKWWALELKGNQYKQIICGAVCQSADSLWLYVPGVKRINVVHSAPIQPDLTGGPLWVPLEVANG